MSTNAGGGIPLAYLTPRGSPSPEGRYHDHSSDGDTRVVYFDDAAHELPGNTKQYASTGPYKGKYTPVATIDAHDPEPDPHSTRVPPDGPWSPWWLRRLVFAVFFSIFASLAAVVIVAYVLSQRNQGLFNAYPDWTYVWRFGPTARSSRARSP